MIDFLLKLKLKRDCVWHSGQRNNMVQTCVVTHDIFSSGQNDHSKRICYIKPPKIEHLITNGRTFRLVPSPTVHMLRT